MRPVAYSINTASVEQIGRHLRRCDAQFVPVLSGRVEIEPYAEKISAHAARFEAWAGDELIGLVAAYCNDAQRRFSHITSVSVLEEYSGRGIASRLLRDCIDYAKLEGVHQISLEVAAEHRAAVRLYERCGFSAAGTNGAFLKMERNARL
jgi:ribosomal protein S18 acetylase RimI-like enzyme